MNETEKRGGEESKVEWKKKARKKKKRERDILKVTQYKAKEALKVESSYKNGSDKWSVIWKKGVVGGGDYVINEKRWSISIDLRDKIFCVWGSTDEGICFIKWQFFWKIWLSGTFYFDLQYTGSKGVSTQQT